MDLEVYRCQRLASSESQGHITYAAMQYWGTEENLSFSHSDFIYTGKSYLSTRHLHASHELKIGRTFIAPYNVFHHLWVVHFRGDQWRVWCQTDSTKENVLNSKLAHPVLSTQWTGPHPDVCAPSTTFVGMVKVSEYGTVIAWMAQGFWPCVGKAWLLRLYPPFHLSPDAMKMPIIVDLTQCLSFTFPSSYQTCPFFYPKDKLSSHLFYWGLETGTLYCFCFVLLSYSPSHSSSHLLFHPVFLVL